MKLTMVDLELLVMIVSSTWIKTYNVNKEESLKNSDESHLVEMNPQGSESVLPLVKPSPEACLKPKRALLSLHTR